MVFHTAGTEIKLIKCLALTRQEKGDEEIMCNRAY